MKPIWIDFKEWETFKNNMYDHRSNDDKIQECFLLLADDKNLKNKMKTLTEKYPNETKVMFTNKMFNPISWLGQATCNLMLGATQKEVCNAWMMLSLQQREIANGIAKQVIKEWRNKHENLHGC